jgi:hypothetical protein
MTIHECGAAFCSLPLTIWMMQENGMDCQYDCQIATKSRKVLERSLS